MIAILIVVILALATSIVVTLSTKSKPKLHSIMVTITFILAIVYGFISHALVFKPRYIQEGAKQYMQHPTDFTISYNYTKVNDSLVCIDTIVELK